MQYVSFIIMNRSEVSSHQLTLMMLKKGNIICHLSRGKSSFVSASNQTVSSSRLTLRTLIRIIIFRIGILILIWQTLKKIRRKKQTLLNVLISLLRNQNSPYWNLMLEKSSPRFENIIIIIRQ